MALMDPLAEAEVHALDYVGTFLNMKPFFGGVALRMSLNGQQRAFILRGQAASRLVRFAPEQGDFLHLGLNVLPETGDEFVVEVEKLLPNRLPPAEPRRGRPGHAA